MALPAIYLENPFLDKDEYTEEEYFAWEESAPGRWEWSPTGASDACGRPLGRIVAMSGGTLEHAEVAGNLLTALKIALRGAGVQMCRVFGSDLKVRAGDGRKTYPDVSAICGRPNFHGGRRDLVTNPILVAEVLSPSTEANDRSVKWASYQTIPTLECYLLISPDSARVEAYARTEGGWRYETRSGLNDTLPLPALGVTLTLADIYAQVELLPGGANG